MKKISLIILGVLVLALSIFFTNCATIATGTSQLITVTSNVSGAEVMLDGQRVGETPFTGEVKKDGKMLTIEKKGYKPYNIALSTTMEGMFWGNIIIGGTLGSITDFASGAAYKYAPASFQVELISDTVAISKFKEMFELKKFAMINMSNIAIDLSNKNGNYLNSLIYLAHLKQNEKSYKLIQELLNRSKGDQVAFGDEVVKLLNN